MAPKLEVFTENAEVFTIAALCHCFLSGFGHRVDHLNQGQEADPEGVNSGITAPESTAYTKRMRPSDNPPRGTPESCF